MRPVLVFVLLLAWAVPSLAQTKRRIALDDIWHLSIPDDPQCSPDGGSVSYTVVQPSQSEQVWMINYDGTSNRRLTSGAPGARRSRFSPDGKYLSYISSSQIWLRSLTGGEVKALPVARVSSYEWSPDGNTLAIVAGNDSRVASPRIYLFELASGRLSRLTDSEASNEAEPSWSPDGRKIAYLAGNQVAVADARPGVRSKALSEANATPGAHIDWSPDGKTLAFLVGAERRLALVPAAGGAKPTSPRAAVDLDRGAWGASWGDTGKAVFVTVADDMSVNGFRVPIGDDEKAGALFAKPVVLGNRHHAGNCAAVVSSGDTKPREIYGLDNGSLRQITHLNDELVAAIDWPKTAEVKFISKDGTEIHGLLTYPLGYKAATRVPLLLRVHGGPNKQDDHSFNPEAQYFAANGYGVLRINYRGSDGRGSRFYSADSSIDDLEAGIDYVVREGIADPERLVIGGADHGGILAESMIAATTKKFKAAVVRVDKGHGRRVGSAAASRPTPTLFFAEQSDPKDSLRNYYERSLAWYAKHIEH